MLELHFSALAVLILNLFVDLVDFFDQHLPLSLLLRLNQQGFLLLLLDVELIALRDLAPHLQLFIQLKLLLLLHLGELRL